MGRLQKYKKKYKKILVPFYTEIDGHGRMVVAAVLLLTYLFAIVKLIKM